MRLMSEQLTPREREVAELVRRGLTNEEIAFALGITFTDATRNRIGVIRAP